MIFWLGFWAKNKKNKNKKTLFLLLMQQYYNNPEKKQNFNLVTLWVLLASGTVRG